MKNVTDGDVAKPLSTMADDPMGENPENANAAAVAIELLGGATIDQTLPDKKMRSIPESVALLLLVIAVAGGGLYAMRKMGLGSKLQFTSVQIDYQLGGGVLDGKVQDLLADLRDNEIEQVPLSQVQKNPFQLIGNELSVADVHRRNPNESDEEAERRRNIEERQRMIGRVFDNLNLKSTLLGPVPVATISGQAVQVGDVVDGLFLIKMIGARSVKLEVDGKLYTLSLGE